MFSDYRIVDNILILNINVFYEFGIDVNNTHKHSSMKKEIKKYMKKVNFNGEKIALMIGGILLATILVVENPKTHIKDLVYTNNSIVLNDQVDVTIPIELSKIDDYIFENSKIEKEEPKLEEKNIVNKEKEVEKEIKEEKIEKVEEVEETSKQEEISTTEIKLDVYRSNGEVKTLNIDEYLIGVVGAEMPASFDIEALKVQAIISRTYALRSLEIGRKLTDTVSTQVYKDNSELMEKWGKDYQKYYEKIKQAVLETKDLAIYHNNKYIDALFFATSNGKTEDSKYVWGSDIPYLKSVDSSWDKDTTPYLRSEEKDLNNVLEILGVTSSNFEIVSKDASGRILEIRIGDKSYTGVEFRNLLGLRSADFDININDNVITFTTRGYGHGVGLSQYGSNEMAKKGYKCQEIIKYYYTGVEVY